MSWTDLVSLPYPNAIHKLVRIPKVEDHLKLGWMPMPTFEGTHHGDWSVHLIWIQCGCKMVVPV